VDGEGNMLLEQVMCLWGYQNELEEQDILQSVKENMFHEDGNLRFSIDHDSEGRLKIRVLPKRDRWSGGGSSTPAWNGAATPTWKPPQRGNPSSWNGKKTPEKHAPTMRGSVAHMGITVPAPKAMSTAKKLDMPLESLIETERAYTAEASMPQPMAEDSEQAAFLRSAFEQATHLRESTRKNNVHRAFEQMGLTAGTSNLRLNAKGQNAKGQNGKGHWNPTRRYTGGKAAAWQKGSKEPQRSDSPMRSRRDGSRSPSPGEEDAALSEMARKTLNVSSDRPLATNGITLDQKKPAPPPGEHWTKYEDEGTVWFYYEGPFGKFWCPNDARDPQPYDDED